MLNLKEFRSYEQLRDLRAELSKARTTLQVLREQIAPSHPKVVYPALHLTRQQHMILAMIEASEGVCQREKIYTVLHGLNPDPPQPRVIDSHVYSIRRQIHPFDIVIRAVHGNGFIMSESSKSKLRELAQPAPLQSTAAGRSAALNLGLTTQQLIILQIVAASEKICSRDEIRQALHSASANAVRNIRFQIYIIRQKTAPIGIHIEIIFREGYRMPEASKQIFQRLITTAPAADTDLTPVELREQLSETNEAIRQLRPFVSPSSATRFYPKLGLTATESKIIAGLVEVEGTVGISRLYDYLYGDRLAITRSEKTIQTFISNLRRKLAPHGIFIATIWGKGYAMRQDSKERLRRFDGVPGTDMDMPETRLRDRPRPSQTDTQLSLTRMTSKSAPHL